MGATMGKNGTLLDSLPSTQVCLKNAKFYFYQNEITFQCIPIGNNAHRDARS